MLDVGCGTGIILPELVRRTDSDVWAIDVFMQDHSLREMMRLEGITVNLAAADLLNLPYKDNFFDAVLLIAVLEHIEDLGQATSEIYRVLKPGGTVVAGFPTKNKITDKLLGGSTGFHVSTHRQIINALAEKFSYFKVTSFPGVLPLDMSLYTACSGNKQI